MRRLVQHDEVGSLPGKGRLLAPVGLSLVSLPNQLSGRPPVALAPVPGDDNGKPRGFLSKSVETALRSAANDDADRLV